MTDTNMKGPLPDEKTEFLCPSCGAVLTEQERTAEGWICKCGDFVPEGLAINPSKGVSCQHKQNRSWR
jgi:hypothetical protein